MNSRWLIRMSRWARNPPPLRRVLLVFAIVAACLALAGAEKFGLWPESFTLDPKAQRRPNTLP